ncbi:MAG: fibronectin type III domain-containing protein, partial [Bacteroidota bacterium]
MKNIKTYIQMKLNNGALLGIKLFSYLFIAILLIISVNTYAQSCANYVVTRDTAVSYSSIAGTGSSLFTWRNTTSNQNDDNRSYQAPIGFDFWYLGIRYTQFSSDLNGFIDFSSSTSDGNSAIMSAPYAYAGNYMNVFSTANASMLALAPMYDDIWTAGSGTAAIANSIVYKTTGTAPNRILTVEWINFDKYGSSSGSINFQIKLHETSGIIEFVYGAITAGSAAYVYCSGINGNWTTGAPTAAQLLTQQTANTNSFSNTAQNNLSVKPVNNSRITFTPPATSAAPSNLTFTAVSKTGTTLNWNDNATNEVGYVIYNSTDNVNYNFVAQTSSNTTSYSISGLSASTLYYYKVYAVSEGKLSSALTGSQITLAAGAITSVGTGNWNTTTTWNCNCIPTSGDIVTIANGHTVTLDANGFCASLIIGQGISGQLTLGNNTTSRLLTIGGDLTVYSGATIIVGSNISTHTMSVLGNIVNNGTINFAPTATRVCNLTVNKNGNQTISGTGNTNNYNLITVNLGSSNTNTLEITSTKFSASTNFLTLTNGTFKLSSAVVITPFTAASTITSTCGLWMNNSSATINLTGGTISLLGYIRATSGTINIGNASDQNLTSNGGTLIIEGGTMNIAGRLDNSGISALTYFTMSSGQLTLATSGSTTALLAPFNFTEIGSTFNFSGGTIIIRKPGSGNLGYVNIGGTNGSVSGGTIQIGDALTPASQTIQINSSIAIPNLVIGNSVAVTALLNTNPPTINNNISINSGSLNSNSLNISLGGNFTNNGSFTAGTGTVILNGTSQTLSGNAVTFNNLTIKNSGVKTLTTGLCTINGILSIEGTATVS